MFQNKSRVLREDPPIHVHGECLEDLSLAQVERITFGMGQIAVNMDACDLPPKPKRAAMLASLGFSNQSIADKFRCGVAYIKQDILGNALRGLGVSKRSGLSRAFLDLGVYTIEQQGQPLSLSPHEEETVELITCGLSNLAIANKLGLAESTIKGYLGEVSHKNYLRGRVEIGLAALLSGQAGDYLPQLALDTLENPPAIVAPPTPT
ncbi:MAG TPA: LuxR C-terminal-related transcriptional regulator [Candidatus Saccharimonadales bacterium]|nr:LuxR C-terminal-related transcriptional regulator [Candidatus Saccharimonadales bacterium]